jgi:hypothetical protein
MDQPCQKDSGIDWGGGYFFNRRGQSRLSENRQADAARKLKTETL